MSDLILHHFDWSPYAEKVRVLLGIKRLAWRSVQIPMVMPKPDLTALTGGYRKTPVLQIGADIYCDTSCIARELESALSRAHVLSGAARAGWSTRWRRGPSASSRPAPVFRWGSTTSCLPTSCATGANSSVTWTLRPFAERTPHMFGQVLANAALVEEQLGDGRAFLMGDRPGLADARRTTCSGCAAGSSPATNDLLQPFTRTAAWEAACARSAMASAARWKPAEALAIARVARAPARSRRASAGDPSGPSRRASASPSRRTTTARFRSWANW